MDSEKHAYIGVDAIIRNSDGKILLMKRNVEPYKGYWGLITGLVKANENVDEALKLVKPSIFDKLTPKKIEKLQKELFSKEKEEEIRQKAKPNLYKSD